MVISHALASHDVWARLLSMGADVHSSPVDTGIQHGPWSHPHAPKLQALGYGTCSALCAPDDFYELDRLQREAFYSLRPTASLACAWSEER